MSGPDPERVREWLAAAVSAIGGSERPGQVAMAEAVAEALDSGRHLIVQAGTGTGKSLAYLVPTLLHAVDTGDPVVVATATLALQAQLVDRDLPRLAESLEPLLGRRPRHATLKGRSNYACLHRVRDGVPDDQGALVPVEDASLGPLAADVLRARQWAEEQAAQRGTGDRDRLEPGVADRAWAQVSVTAKECLGAPKCPYGGECFAETARARAADADVVVTNHALLAIDALEGVPVLPEHDVVVVDEAHELVGRVTGVATADLVPAVVERCARRCRVHVEDSAADALHDAASSLRAALTGVAGGRLDVLPEGLAAAVAEVRDAARGAQSGFSSSREERSAAQEAARRQARALVDEVHATAARIAAGSELDVVWVEERERAGSLLRVAPLSVAGLLRDRLFGVSTVVATSATLALGGSFDAVTRSYGLGGEEAPPSRGLDVGSPFDYARQAILYVARHLPPPGRDGLRPAAIDELVDLMTAAEGRTLGLFSSRRGAVEAAEAVRARAPQLPVLCQGEDQVSTLVRQFGEEPRTSLFGTLSLWQGVDVPGEACQLVVIDRLPFPRPDDPLASARQRAVERAGGNGFMSVAATHAALLLAQGTGRLVRRDEDRGVVAVLDPRLVTARYGDFLRRSLPPMWFTTDRQAVLGALGRLAAAAS
ncbi:MAG TPA: ATP-dependent DNA helicase [Jiangellales bacterium]|nr:ATP-dependent DNA helicase [Jiangellales bacterium]